MSKLLLDRKGKKIREAILQIPTKLNDTLARSDKRTIYKLLSDEIKTTVRE